jgi:hypothetical protein
VQKYEHKITTLVLPNANIPSFGEEDLSEFAHMGADGWRLVAVYPNTWVLGAAKMLMLFWERAA